MLHVAELLPPGVGGRGLLPPHQLGPRGHPPLQGRGPDTTRCSYQRYSVKDIQHSSQKTLYSEIKLTQVRKCSQSPQRFLNFVLFLDQTWTNLHVLFMIRLAGEEQYKRRCLAGVVTRFCSLNGSWSQLDLALDSTCFTPGGGAGHHHHHHSVPLLIYFVGVLCNGVTLPAGNQTNLTI